MKQKNFSAAVGKLLAGITATLLVSLILAPHARAQNNYKVLYIFTGGTDGA